MRGSGGARERAISVVSHHSGRTEVDAARQLAKGAEMRGVEQARESRIRRALAIRRAIGVDGSDRQRLPDAEPAGPQPIDEPPRLGSDRAVCPAAGHRRRMKQNPRAPRAEHVAHLKIYCDARLSAASMLRVTSTTPFSVT